jgi:hypothetical protein
MKSVNLDEVFVKLKEISNPGHPHDSCKCGCRESGGSDRKKSLRRRPQKKKIPIFDGRAGQLCSMPNTFLDSWPQVSQGRRPRGG